MGADRAGLKPLRILHLEDDSEDTEIARETLKAAAVPIDEICRVETEGEFLRELARPFDVILADWRLPAYDGLAALSTAQERAPNVPFIVLSGTMGEEAAIDSLKAGATDYVLKGQISKLAPAVTRAVQQAEERARRLRAEAEREELFAREQAARAEAERAGRMKDEFLAALSHEIRTPLTPVLAMAQLMEGDPTLSLRHRESLAMMRRNVELEARLIDDLLDLTRIRRGKIEYRFDTVDLHEKLGHVVKSCEGSLRAKGIVLTAALKAEEHLVRADGARLQQVFWNLLSNAVKFTPAGGRVTISTENQDGRILVSVEDSGIGLEAELLPRLFRPFEQGGRSVTRQFGGLGLGLAISREIVDAHGGTLSARSDGQGQGAGFTVELRTATARAPAGARPPPRSSHPPGEGTREGGLKGGRLLLVEDHADTAETMSMLLEGYGFQVRVAGSVAAALEALEAEPFDLLISDLRLPDGSGLELMRQLRVKRPIKGIAMSGYGMNEDVQRSLEAGFMAHLVKPVSLPVLENAIRRACG